MARTRKGSSFSSTFQEVTKQPWPPPPPPSSVSKQRYVTRSSTQPSEVRRGPLDLSIGRFSAKRAWRTFLKHSSTSEPVTISSELEPDIQGPCMSIPMDA